jgi:hypothetical protein
MLRQNGLPSPVIVAKGRFVNRATPIPTTTLFTPSADGLFRLSIYMTETVTGANVFDSWVFVLNWNDDAGAEGSNVDSLTVNQAPPGAWGNEGFAFAGTVQTFEAKASQPVTFTVTYSPPTPSGAYSLYYVVERLE